MSHYPDDTSTETTADLEARVPPYDAEAERAVLGAVLLDNGALARARALLAPEDLYSEVHRLLLQVMIRLIDAGTPADAVSLGAALRAAGDWDRVGGAGALVGLTDAVATTANVEHYAAVVARCAARRRVIYAAQEIVARGFATRDDDTDNYLEDAHQAITAATVLQHTAGPGPRRVATDFTTVYAGIERGTPAGVVPTGIVPYDNFYGGLWPGLLHVIGGRPSMGKSALALNIATNAARSGRKVLYLCLEDTREQLVLRLLARLAGQNLHALSLGRINADGFTAVLGTSTLLDSLPLWTDDTPGKTSAQWVRVVRRHKATKGLDLVIVDHLGEVSDTGENETAITSRAAITFRDMAKELDVPTVLLAQLNRAVEQRPNKRPTRSDLRQSGVIEQIARFILFPFRGGYYSGEHARRDMELIVAKATNFPIATFRCFADMAHMYVRGWEIGDGAWTGDEAAGTPTEQRNAQTTHDDTY